MEIVISEDLEKRAREALRTVVRTPFTKRTWSELAFLITGSALAAFGLAFVLLTMAAGIVFVVTFLGLIIIALSVRGARGIGGMQRALTRGLLHETIAEPAPFTARPGFFGWLQSALRDGPGWKAIAYLFFKVPLSILAILAAFSVWWDAFTCLTFPFSGAYQPASFGVVRWVFAPGYLSVGGPSWIHSGFIVFTGVILLFAAPWAVRAIIYLDRTLMHAMLGPDPLSVRVQSLEHARAQTVDASAATLRRIERDLHDGTQAQLVALAMQLGMAKEKLADTDNVDIEQVRALVDDAHKGAKEAITELRDLARGIHPPALDIGLEGALSTLAARCTVPTELEVSIADRPTPAIEAIAYFCVAELLANIAQHAEASRARITCAQHGRWLRVVVRDDGKGGAQPSKVGSSSSGLIGLGDRVHTVDGQFDIISPRQGPTVVTIDLPLNV
jgi:signal transduction histidine kinase